jgi:nitroimidazol reductase NimA-like FMN-containing flavoprotein (pyridoxamine 5'-phosphate oxidase superfamily)
MPAKLTKEEAHAFLDGEARWIYLTTIGRNGYPHTVPIGFFRIDDDIYAGGHLGTQRLANIGRNTKVGALFESGSSMQDIKGLLVQGDASIVSEPSEVLKLMRASMAKRGVPEEQLPTEPRPNVAYIKITPRKYISWDYSREG